MHSAMIIAAATAASRQNSVYSSILRTLIRCSAAFYGVPDLSNSQGLHTNAVYGFLNIMFAATAASRQNSVYSSILRTLIRCSAPPSFIKSSSCKLKLPPCSRRSRPSVTRSWIVSSSLHSTQFSTCSRNSSHRYGFIVNDIGNRNLLCRLLYYTAGVRKKI